MDHSDTGLRAIGKSLSDVVAPAVNRADPLAGEQLRLAIDYVEFVRNRLDYYYDREQFELRHHLGMARTLRDIAPSIGDARLTVLKTAIADGERTQATAGVSSRKLKRITASLAAVIAAIVRQSASMDESIRTKIERSVLEATDERIAFERSWYLPLGFDPAPTEVVKLEVLCGED